MDGRRDDVGAAATGSWTLLSPPTTRGSNPARRQAIAGFRKQADHSRSEPAGGAVEMPALACCTGSRESKHFGRRKRVRECQEVDGHGLQLAEIVHAGMVDGPPDHPEGNRSSHIRACARAGKIAVRKGSLRVTIPRGRVVALLRLHLVLLGWAQHARHRERSGGLEVDPNRLAVQNETDENPISGSCKSRRALNSGGRRHILIGQFALNDALDAFQLFALRAQLSLEDRFHALARLFVELALALA